MRALAHDPLIMETMRQELEAVGLTMGVAKAMLRLNPGRPTSMRHLAGELRCDNSYITTVVDALEQRGLATREAHPTDRRIKVIVLTDEGEQTRKRVEEIMLRPPPAFSSLSGPETAQLAALLKKLQVKGEALV